jgi:putative Ig domain-containing protein
VKRKTTEPYRLARSTVFAALLFTVAACNDCDLKIGTDELPDGVVGVDYSARIDSDCGGDQFFFDEGHLPPGIEIQSDGDLRGTPIAAGTFTFTVGVVDFGSGDEAVKGFQIVVH